MIPGARLCRRWLACALPPSLLISAPCSSVTIPWYIMTSAATHSDTVAFFEAKQHFGLAADQVFFLQQVQGCRGAPHCWPRACLFAAGLNPQHMQGMLPCLTEAGSIIMATLGSMATAPDGNGGVYAALGRRASLSLPCPAGPLHHAHRRCAARRGTHVHVRAERADAQHAAQQNQSVHATLTGPSLRGGARAGAARWQTCVREA